MTKNKTAAAIGWCYTHDKLMYTNRKRAKSVARQHPDHKGVYPCEANQGMFHIGALPWEVIAGELTREQFFKERRGERPSAA